MTPTRWCYTPCELSKNHVYQITNTLGPLYLQKSQLDAPLYAIPKAHRLKICFVSVASNFHKKEKQMATPLGDLTAFTWGFKFVRGLSTHAMLKINGIYNDMELNLLHKK